VAAAAAVLWLLACVNAAGLAAARHVERRREHAVKRALGAGAFAIGRAAAVETLVLVIASVALGLLLARLGLAATLHVLPPSVTLLKTPAIDWRVVGATLLIALVAMGVVAAMPVWLSLRSTVLPSGRDASGATRIGRRARISLIAGQTALGFVLVVGGGLTLASLVSAWRSDVGYRRDRLAIVQAFADHPRTDASTLVASFRDALAKLPGVDRVAATTIPMFFAPGGSTPPAAVSSRWAPPGTSGAVAGVTERRVDRDFFGLTGVRFLAGEPPSAGEWRDDAPVAIVSARAARIYWPDRPAVGQTLVWNREDVRDRPAPRRVIAVVSDVRFVAADREPVGDVYFPGAIQDGTYGSFFVVSTTEPAEGLFPAFVATAAAHALRVDRVATIEDALFTSVRHRWLPAWLFGGLGVMGLAVLGAGSLGLVLMTTAQRRREIGIRMALGASARRVAALIVREHLRAVALGVAIGAAAAAWMVGALQAELYGVGPHHLGVWFAVTVVVVATALLGSLVPARLAARIDPVRTLRAE
jgi:predicted permease